MAPSNTPVCTKKVLDNSKSLVGLRCLPSQQIITNCTKTRCGWLDSHGANCLGNTANSSHSQQLWGSENSDQCDQVKMKSLQCDKFEIEERSLVESWEGERLKRETRDPGLEWKSGRLLFSRKEDRMERERSWIGMVCMGTCQREPAIGVSYMMPGCPAAGLCLWGSADTPVSVF